MTLSGLLPFTTYRTYCTAVTLQGNEMTLTAARASGITATTLCCKTVTVRLNVGSLVESSTLQRGLSVTFDAPPSSSVTALLTFRSSASAGSAASSVFPSSQLVRSTSAQVGQVQYFTAVAGVAGIYTLEVVLSGPSAAEYNVSYSGSRVLRVLAADVEPGTPQLLSATFSSDGSSVAVAFSAPTDKGGYQNAFPCAKLLNFTGSSAASCQWSDNAKMVVYPVYSTKAPDSVLRVSSAVQIYPLTVRAACTSSTNVTRCKSWAAVPSTQMLVAKPTAPLQPKVVLSVPSTIGGCSSLTVDLTSSTGAAGRPWASAQFKVLTTLGATPAALQLENYLAANFTLNPPTAIPYDTFQKGYTYSIQATLCNFLASCASSVKTVSVLASVSAVPVVSILGQSQRSIARNAQLVLSTNAYTQSCSGAVSSANLAYFWSVRRFLSDGTLAATDLRSSSQSPTSFKLPAYMLTSSTQYEIAVTVDALASGLSASAAVTVSVIQGSVVAVVSGGSSKQLRVADSVQLDASQSYDEDINGKKGIAAGLSFLWTCVQIKPVFISTCALVIDDPRKEKLSVVAAFAALNTTSLFTVTVSDATRSSTAQVEVTVTGAAAPTLDITSNLASLSNVNTGKQLVLYGSLQLFVPCASTLR